MKKTVWKMGKLACSTKDVMSLWFQVGVICAALLTRVFAAPGAVGDPAVPDFLRRNATVLDLRLPDAGLGVESITTQGQRIFLLAEVHGVAANYTLDLALLRHLHRVAGVRVYVMEFSHANAQFMNRFLQTGDPAPLDFVLGQMWGFVDCSEQRRKFFVALREWNLTLPADERVRVVGFDLERMPGISLTFLRQQLAGLNPPMAIRSAVERLRALPEMPTKVEVRAVVAELAAGVAAQHDIYATLLQTNWFDFDLALDNLVDNERLQADRSHYDARRDAMQYHNFMRIAAHTPFTTAYGRVGSAHVLQHVTGTIKHFSAWLESPDSPWAGQVVGIWPLYVACRRLTFAHGRYGTMGCEDEPMATQPFVGAAASNLVLFKLTGGNSPFAHQLLLPGEATDGVTTDYFQYVVLLKSAAANTPLRRNHSAQAGKNSEASTKTQKPG